MYGLSAWQSAAAELEAELWAAVRAVVRLQSLRSSQSLVVAAVLKIALPVEEMLTMAEMGAWARDARAALQVACQSSAQTRPCLKGWASVTLAM